MIRILMYLVVVMQIAPAFAQQTDFVNFISSSVALKVDVDTKTVRGEVHYEFQVDQAIDSVFIDAKNMEFDKVLLDGKAVKTHYDTEKLWLISDFLPNTTHQLLLDYEVVPQKAVYFVKDHKGNDQIWTQGQGKYTSNWLPSFDDVNEKIIFDITIEYDSDYEVIANGKLQSKKTTNGVTTWKYDMIHPMSSYLVAFVIGTYAQKTTFSKSGIPLTYYYYPEDTLKFEPTYRYSKQMFDFLERKIGVPYPWQDYKQIPVKDFLYAGMENTGTTIFSDAFVVDSIAYTDRTYSNVNAHELAHQWFGDLVTAKEGTHHWLQEGFATYYALLAEREVLGEDYFYYKLYESAEQLDAQSNGKNATAVLNPKASSLTFYQHGAWVLHALQDKVGVENFDTAVQQYLNKYQFGNVKTADFMNMVAEVSGEDLTAFRALWLETAVFPSKEALKLLEKSSFIKKYLNLAKERTQPLAGKIAVIDEALDFPVNDYVGQEAVYQLEGDVSPQGIELYKKAFATNNIYVRQAIATTLNKIPARLKKDYESLLSDPSFVTQEATLYHLWTNYPTQRKEFLDQMKDVVGFSDKNIRTLWLVLAISTPEYEASRKKHFFDELNAYTTKRNTTKVRQNAFTYLESLQLFSDQALQSLVDGATHYNWRFRDFCRKILDKLLQDERYRKKFVVLKKHLAEQQQRFLEKKLLIPQGGN